MGFRREEIERKKQKRKDRKKFLLLEKGGKWKKSGEFSSYVRKFGRDQNARLYARKGYNFLRKKIASF